MRMKRVVSLALASLMALSTVMPGSALQVKAASSEKSVQGEAALPLDQVAVHGREKLNFNQGWKFVRQYIAEAIDVDYPTETLERWESVNLPHTVRVEPFNNSGGINYQGPAMYRKQFTVPKEYAGKKMFIEFEGAMGVTDVWVNGTHLQTKSSAKTGSYTNVQMYLPFVLDITDAVNAGSEENVITVLVDNSDNWNVPPGKPQAQLDYTYPGGIYRNVWIEVADPVHITNATFEDIAGGGGILVDYPQVSEGSAEVAVKTHIRNESDEDQTVQLVTKIIDKEDQVVASDDMEQMISSAGDFTFDQTVTVSSPKLWNVDTPYLYTLVSSVFVDGVEVDQQETAVGIRTIEFSAEGGLKVNGKDEGFLQGVNRHQEYAYLGYAASSSLQRRDAIKFKEAGINFVRASCHTPSADFLDACDELGIFVMEAIPGWQHWSTAPEFAEREREEVKYMIRRDRNRPSILTFEISLNESTSVPTEFTNELAAIARAEHPSIRISAENPHAGATADVLYGTPEQVAAWSDTACSVIREYADHWIEQSGDLSTICRVTRGPGSFYPGGEAAMVYQANRAVWTGFPHYFGTGAISLADAYKMYEDTNHRFVGVNKWIGIDHNRGYHATMSPCGLWDLARLPKYMYYAYASQPTESHSNWQWWNLVKNSRPIILDDTEKSYRPIMQAIDNFGNDKTVDGAGNNRKLGLIFEGSVGEGKVLICSIDLLDANKNRPEAKQLYDSIIKYMDSDAFAPSEELSSEMIDEWIRPSNMADGIAVNKSGEGYPRPFASYSLGGEARLWKILNGKVDTTLPNESWTSWDNPNGAAGDYIGVEFDGKIKTNQINLHVFEDHGCKAPETWEVQYLKDGEWLPVENASLLDKEAMTLGKNTITFDWVTTSSIRIFMTPQKGMSLAIAEFDVQGTRESSFYEDVTEDDWFCDAVRTVTEENLMTGLVPGEVFGPYENLSRAQFAMILYRMEGEAKVEAGQRFLDIPSDAWYADAVAWAADNKIVTGYEGGRFFGPADNVTREQIATMLYRYAQYKGYDLNTSGDYSKFQDAANVSGYADDAMKWAVGNGIIVGKDGGTLLDARSNTLRYECAVILARVLQVFAK